MPQVALPGLLDDLVGLGFALDPAVVIREYVREHLTEFPFGRVRVDCLKPVLPLYSRALADADHLEWTEGQSVRVVTADGLILTKMVAFRPQDQVDVESFPTANRVDVNVDLIREEWPPFAATETERTAWLEAVIVRRVIRRE